MSARRVTAGSRDFISRLPDEVLGKIVSLLPTNHAASTSILSKRWRNLLVLVNNLNLSDASGDPRGFSDFVDKNLALLSNSVIIKTFSLNCEHKHDRSRVDSWIRIVLERSFLELHLESACMHFIETESFTSSTLVKLTLSNGFYLAGLPPHGGVFFPKLKTLSLITVGFGDCEVYEYLISGCPVLEELFIRYGSPSACSWMVMSHSIAVLNHSIKRLTISYPFPGYREPPDRELFQTPSLVYLDYSSYVTGQYHVDLTSLVEARLDLRKDTLLAADKNVIDNTKNGIGRGWGENDLEDDFDDDDIDDEDDDSDSDSDSDGDGEDILPDVTNLIAGISNVKTLHLSSYSLEAFHSYCKSMPVFHKLLTLSFESDKERGWQVVPVLLSNSPNLETLIIKGLVHRVTDRCGDACVCISSKKKKKKKMEDEVCCLSTCQVKLLNIKGYGGTRREQKQMRHFLGNLKCLETVKVGVEAENHREESNDNNNYQKITNALTKLPRASSNCQIHFF